MIRKFEKGKRYKSKNRDGTFMYFKVTDIDDERISFYVYRDDDNSGTYLSPNTTYKRVGKNVSFLYLNGITKVDDSEYLAMVL